jgi:hypothetical protein
MRRPWRANAWQRSTRIAEENIRRLQLINADGQTLKIPLPGRPTKAGTSIPALF